MARVRKTRFSDTWVYVYNKRLYFQLLQPKLLSGLTCLIASASIAGLLRTTENMAETNVTPLIVSLHNAKAVLLIASKAKSVVETGIIGSRGCTYAI